MMATPDTVREDADGRLAIEAFVRSATVVTVPPLVPEVRLRLAAEPHGIFQAAETFERPGDRMPPFWAFAWPGGQATARYLLDRPEMVRGRRVIDIGAGSGIAAIAAAMAGAADVLAADVDPLAVAAIGLNAELNGVRVRATASDLLGILPAADLVLIGDLVYEPELASRVARCLEGLVHTSTVVLVGDRTTARRPPLPFDEIAEHAASVVPALTDAHFERARLWRLRPSTRRGRS